MDADGSHDPQYLQEMIKALSNYDIVVGSRYVGEGCTYDNTFIRKKISTIYNKLVKTILNINILDSMSGYIVAKKSVFSHYSFPSNYKFMLPLYTQNPKYKICEYPIIFHRRKAGESKVSFLEGFCILWQVLKLRVKNICL